MSDALEILLKGLKEYKHGEDKGERAELLDGISDCQLGSRNAMMGLLLWKTPMGLSHAIGHQLGSVCGVMHGVTSCIMLASVLRFSYEKNEKQRKAQQDVLVVWNKTLEWEEKSLAEAVNKFVRMLELPSTLEEVGIGKDEEINKVADPTLTDILAVGAGVNREEVVEMLNLARR
jgi:alcohol dehydrogenase class IV